MFRTIRSVASMSALVLVLVACGGDSTATTAPPTTVAPTASTTASAPTTTQPAPTTTTSSTSTTSTTLAGDAADGPTDGARLMVVAVPYDEGLNLRSAPGTDQQILDRIPPTYTDLVASGEARQLAGSRWYQVDYDGTIGWVNASYLAYQGTTAEIGSRIADEMGGTPSATGLLELAAMVAGHVAQEATSAELTVVFAPTDGREGEAMIDITGLEDDSIGGVRLHIVAQLEGGVWVLQSVQQTLLCSRGIGAEESCL